VRRRKTDYGTIILHWVLVGATGVALVTGLRIATETPERGWINCFDLVLPRDGIWMWHMQAATVLVTVALAYTIYVIKSGLSRRVALDKTRLRGLFGRKQTRWGAFSVVLTWGFFVAMLALITSGGCLYFGVYAGYTAAAVHWYATWLVFVFAGLHIVTHYKLGGASQLLRIFRPQQVPAPAPKLDAIELLTMLVEQSEGSNSSTAGASLAPRDQTGPRHPAAAPRRAIITGRRVAHRRNVSVQANPFVVAAAVAITGALLLVGSDRLSVDALRISRIAPSDAPVLDGDTSDRVWRSVKPFSVLTNSGGNFDGTGESRVEIRAVHDGTWAYFLFTWQDPTRSLKQLPLVKKADGWHVLHNGYEIGDEHEFNEDKFSVLLTTSTVTLAGDRTFHAGPQPVSGAPATKTGRGLHFTTNGSYADVWEWKATSGGPSGWMDDAHFGPPQDPTPAQTANVVPYRGGFAPDPGSANYTDNFVAAGGPSDGLVTPRRLPRDIAATRAAMGAVVLDPDVGESDGARWFISDAESVPYSPELDRDIPEGTVIPGVVLNGDFIGDRADVRCAARWASGHWSLEVARRLDTHSEYDVALKTGTFMRVAAFDHSQIRHTRHIQPIRLEVE
jgi:hypothetical protein